MNLSSTLEHDVATGVSSIHEIEISSVHPNPNQPRKIFNEEALEELASSIVRHGLLEPIVVKDAGNGAYMILAGERRYRASKLAGAATIKAIIDTDADEFHNLHEKALVENIQRENLTDFEIALQVEKLWNTKEYESKKDLAISIGKSQSYVSKCFGILEKLDSWILKEFKEHGTTIGLSVMEEISRLPAENQVRAYKDYQSGYITREDLKDYKAQKYDDAELTPYEQEIMERGKKVPSAIQEIAKNSPNIVITGMPKNHKIAYGFGTQNEFGTFITLSSGDIGGTLEIRVGGEFVKTTFNKEYKVTIEEL